MTPAQTRAAAPAVPLSDRTLPDLPPEVSVPTYDRAALRPGIVHIGVGGFHRAHQAVYLDELARAGETGWGVVGVGLHSREIGEVLAGQDGLWTVVERGADGDRATVVGVLTRYLYAPDDPEAVLAALTDERTRVVTLTITGTGYRVDAHTGEFDADDPHVARDLEDPGSPETVFGYLVEALHRRREAGQPPFTVLSCDNMQSNGSAARTAVVSFARLRDGTGDDGLAEWIDEHVAFPSSMVDRITPNTSPEDRDAVAAGTGVDDRWPVVTEPFRQWVVEDSFCNGRPPLEQVGVRFVDDVSPYETVKTRLLNAGHSAIAYLGYLAGYRTTADVMADPVFRDYLTRLMAEEIAPHLPEVPGVDLDEYQATLLGRLANPRMADQLSRLGRRGSTKIPNYLLPSVRAAMEAGRPHRLLCVAVAGWLRFLRGHDYAGDEVPVQGPRLDLVPIAQEAGGDAAPLLSERSVFDHVGQDPRFADCVQEALSALDRQGPREVVEQYLADGAPS
ncbi:fructuronate reductase/mannitol 2-dehydrogenase [Geodermatophilus tzadiensis]|uniref:Mannitol-1-phosphate 5-dehydrogenase n=1 Tax=Geodermatophilus tzadiensis TaxID=1137988 RepID=A0A2T0U068_9ACTN|nr:mannitol dehydrogenase family protein [Geodermatophilus tzadiensis]PRY51303.1 fructuronate reductase/mannitol 2-dehydrogenase [Geodermatophilus tzadiensis]